MSYVVTVTILSGDDRQEAEELVMQALSRHPELEFIAESIYAEPIFEEADTSLRPRPGESAEDTINRVVAAIHDEREEQ